MAQALTNLRASSDFRLFVAMLEKTELAEMKSALTHTDILLIGRGQGRAGFVSELLNAISDAPTTLEKLK